MANISKIKTPDGTTYDLKDSVSGYLTSSSTLDATKLSGAVPAASLGNVKIGTATGSGNAITSLSVSNGTITPTKGTTFLTSHQDISGKVDKSGDTMTGGLTISTATNHTFRVSNTTTTGVLDVISSTSGYGGLKYEWSAWTDSDGIEHSAGNNYPIIGDRDDIVYIGWNAAKVVCGKNTGYLPLYCNGLRCSNGANIMIEDSSGNVRSVAQANSSNVCALGSGGFTGGTQVGNSSYGVLLKGKLSLETSAYGTSLPSSGTTGQIFFLI